MAKGGELTISVDGKKYGGWKSFRITRGLERAVADFTIDASERWPGMREGWALLEGAPLEAWLDDDKVMTGYIDRVTVRYDARSHAVSIAGRSKTSDLVDCSVVELKSWANVNLHELAKILCRPFGIEVVCDIDVGKAFPIAAAQLGEEPWKLLERLARQRMVLLTDDPEGRLVLTRLGHTYAADKIKHPHGGWKQVEGERDHSDRFSEYIVKGQASSAWAPHQSSLAIGGEISEGGGSGGEVAEGQAAKAAAVAYVTSSLAHAEATFRDPGVRRYRPKLVMSESGTSETMGVQERAEWEARRRIGRSYKVAAQRAGWRQSNGALWTAGLLTRCELPFMKLNETMGVSEVTWSRDVQGTLCGLRLVSPVALTPDPPDADVGGAGAAGNIRWGFRYTHDGRENR